MTSDILKRAAEAGWLPCPLCGAELQAWGDDAEHPASDTCPLDSLWLLPEHSAAWNKRIPDMAAAIAEREAEIERLTARAEAAEAMFSATVGMINIVEGVDGAMNHGTWRDERGMRLKDTPEWVALYNAHAAMKEGR